MIERIVVPTDGSEHAGKAVVLAADLAGKYGARIVLLHVVVRDFEPETIRRLIDVGNLPASAREELERTEEMRRTTAKVPEGSIVTIPLSGELYAAVGSVILDDAEQVVRSHGTPDVSSVLMHGDPAQAILSVADRDTDMIIMGSRGLTDLKGLFIGSVSHKVSNHSNCTCVTVK